MIDLTTNTSAFGLCSDEWKAAMQAHVDAGGETQWFSGEQWREAKSTCGFENVLAYRAKPGPVVTVESHDAFLGQYGKAGFYIARDDFPLENLNPGTLAVTLHDGKPVRAEWVAKDEVKP